MERPASTAGEIPAGNPCVLVRVLTRAGPSDTVAAAAPGPGSLGRARADGVVGGGDGGEPVLGSKNNGGRRDGRRRRRRAETRSRPLYGDRRMTMDAQHPFPSIPLHCEHFVAALPFVQTSPPRAVPRPRPSSRGSRGWPSNPAPTSVLRVEPTAKESLYQGLVLLRTGGTLYAGLDEDEETTQFKKRKIKSKRN